MEVNGWVNGGPLQPIMKIDIKTNHQITKLIGEIDSFKGSWKAFSRLTPERLEQLKKIATIESIASSTRIEGVKLTDTQVRTLLNNLSVQSFSTRDEQEVAGYAKCMDLIFDSFNSIPLDENHIKQLHSILLSFSSKDERHRGEYKKLRNDVAAYDPEGKVIGIVFETTTPLETPAQMKELVEFTNKALQESEIHPLLIVGAFVVYFLAIHPFQDGNGRLSRVLTTLLLLQCGYEYVAYSSMERVIEKNKKEYYIALRQAQKTIREDEVDITPWLVFFLESMRAQKNHLGIKIEQEQMLNQLPPLSQKILELVELHGSVSNQEIQNITRMNRATIKDHLKGLVDSNRLVLQGKGRGARYILPHQ